MFELVFFIISIFLLSGMFLLYIFTSYSSKEAYIFKKYVFPIFCLLLEFISFFMSSFTKLHINKVISIFYGIIALICTIFSFIKNNFSERKYILFLQEKYSLNKKMNDLFEFKYNETTFKQKKYYGDEEFFYEKLNSKNVISYNNKKLNWNLLIPKKKMSKEALQYICKQLNIFYNSHSNNKLNIENIQNLEISVFKNEEIYYFAKNIIFDDKKYKDQVKKNRETSIETDVQTN